MKAQFWSIDMIFAIVIFSGAIIMLSVVWLNINNQLSTSYGFGIGMMQLQLNSLIQRLQSTGSPPRWNSFVSVNDSATWSNVSIGLGTGNGSSISTNKIMSFMAMANSNYQSTKQLLGVGYDYYVTITSQGQYNISIGRSPIAYNATAIQVASVPVILDNGQAGTMRIIVWTNTTFGVG